MSEPRVGLRLTWDEYEQWIQDKKRERWARILAEEPAHRAVRRRFRDPLKEVLLTHLDQLRLDRERSGCPLPSDLTYDGFMRVLGDNEDNGSGGGEPAMAGEPGAEDV